MKRIIPGTILAIIVLIFLMMPKVISLYTEYWVQAWVGQNDTRLQINSYDSGWFNSSMQIGLITHNQSQPQSLDIQVFVEHGPVLFSDYSLGFNLINSNLDQTIAELKPLHDKLNVDHLLELSARIGLDGSKQVLISSPKRYVSNRLIKFKFEGMSVRVNAKSLAASDAANYGEHDLMVFDIDGQIGALDFQDVSHHFSLGKTEINATNFNFAQVPSVEASVELMIRKFVLYTPDKVKFNLIRFKGGTEFSADNLLNFRYQLALQDMIVNITPEPFSDIEFDLSINNIEPQALTALINLNNQKAAHANLRSSAQYDDLIKEQIENLLTYKLELSINKLSYRFSSSDYSHLNGSLTLDPKAFKLLDTDMAISNLLAGVNAEFDLVASKNLPVKLYKFRRRQMLEGQLSARGIDYLINNELDEFKQALNKYIADGLIAEEAGEYVTKLVYHQRELSLNGKKPAELF